MQGEGIASSPIVPHVSRKVNKERSEPPEHLLLNLNRTHVKSALEMSLRMKNRQSLWNCLTDSRFLEAQEEEELKACRNYRRAL